MANENNKVIGILLFILILGGQLLYAYSIYTGIKDPYTVSTPKLIGSGIIYGILIVYFFLTTRHSITLKKLLLITIILQFFILYYPLVNSLPRRPNTYRFLNHLDYIAKYHHTNPSDTKHLDYHSWPAFFLWEYAIVSILDIPAIRFLWAFPIIIKTLLILLVALLYNMFKRCLVANTKHVQYSITQFSLIFFVSSLWININGEPQHLGYFFFILTHYILSSIWLGNKSMKMILLGTITYSVFVFTHALYSLTLLILLILLMFSGITLSVTKNTGINQRTIKNLALFSAIVFLLWLLFGAYSQVVEKSPAVVSSILQWILQKTSITPKPSGNLTVQFYTRLVNTSLVLFGGLIGYFYLLLDNTTIFKRKENISAQGLHILYLGVGLLAPFLLSPLSLSYGDEIRTRIFYLVAPFASFALSYLLLRIRHKNIRKALCYIFVATMISISFPAEYLNENINHVEYSDLVGVKFSYTYLFEQTEHYNIYAPGTVPLYLKYHNVNILYPTKKHLSNRLYHETIVLIINTLFRETVKSRAFQTKEHSIEQIDVIEWSVTGNKIYNNNNFEIIVFN